ncbi:MAG: type III pantothenate kinase [Sphingomonadales bacterium]|nr:type III pantothenate kinase [Sphingomonadales bacterium]
MSVTLCFDFGNTRKKVAVFDGSVLREAITLTDDTEATISALLRTYCPEKSILSSVIAHNPLLETMLDAATRFHKLDHTTKLSFTTPVGKPATIGADRLAICAAAVHYYPGMNNLVIALGSCITYNFINAGHAFLGGGISPGLAMRLRSLHQHTALLPLVAPVADVPLIGYDTQTNILSGVLLGMALEMDGFIDSYKARYDNFNVVLTGGDIPYLAAHFKNKIFADPDLIYKGLYAISEVNNT